MSIPFSTLVNKAKTTASKLPPSTLFGIGGAGASSLASLFLGGSSAIPQTTAIRQPNPYAVNPYNVNPYAVNPYDENANTYKLMADMQEQAVNIEAQNQDMMAQQAIAEAQADAIKTAREAHQFQEQQAVDYSQSGVYLPGSPSALLTLNETRKLAEQEVNARINQGAALARLYTNKGYQGRMQGRAALLGNQMQWNAEKNSYAAKGLQNDASRDLYNMQGTIFDINQGQSIFEADQKNALAQGLKPGRGGAVIKSLNNLAQLFFGM